MRSPDSLKHNQEKNYTTLYNAYENESKLIITLTLQH